MLEIFLQYCGIWPWFRREVESTGTWRTRRLRTGGSEACDCSSVLPPDKKLSQGPLRAQGWIRAEPRDRGPRRMKVTSLKEFLRHGFHFEMKRNCAQIWDYEH